MSSSDHLLDRPVGDPAFWLLDPSVIYLNHGAFGACPKPVLKAQSEWRERMEQNPLQFLARELEPHLDNARTALAQFVGATPNNLVFVSNATTGVNAVLRSLSFQPGDELLTTNHAYNASCNALRFVAERAGAKVVVADLPFPFRNEEELIAPILSAISPRTRLALIDHVTSPTGMVLPLARILSELNARGVESLVDGAHAPGMIPLDLERLGSTYYTGNCHKWLCGPKGAGFLHVRPERQEQIRPVSISHGANSRRTDRSRFQIEFGWTGTSDPTAWLSIPEALRFLGSLLPGGLPELMTRNRALALEARRLLCETLSIPEPCPAGFIGTLASIPLADAEPAEQPRPPIFEFPLQDRLRLEHRIEVPIMPWPTPKQRLLRIAAQAYNSLPQYKLLARALAGPAAC